MKLMGMKGWIYWASWYFKCLVFMIIAVTLMTAVLHSKVVGGRAVLPYGDPTVTFVFLLLYGLSFVTLGFAISTFFSTGMITDASDKGIYS